MQLRVVYEKEMTADLDGRIRAALCHCFPADHAVFSRARGWHGSVPAWTLILEDARQRVAAHVGIVERTIAVGDATLRVAGVQNVCVLPEYRSRGYCDQVMNAMTNEATCQEYECGLLFCGVDLCKVYRRCGWTSLDARTIVRTNKKGESVNLPSGNTAMFLPLVTEKFPQGDIHLRGNDW